MLRRTVTLLSLAALVLGSALVAPRAGADPARAKRVSRVHIKKGEHRMLLLAADGKGNEELVASYRVAIGPGGAGPKRQEGDLTTPVGRYHVTMRQRSRFTIFLGLDYPTPADRRRFELLKQRGDLPRSATIGGAIGIHGPPASMNGVAKRALKAIDWTAGCVAVDEDEIREVARLVGDGTVVDIED